MNLNGKFAQVRKEIHESFSQSSWPLNPGCNFYDRSLVFYVYISLHRPCIYAIYALASLQYQSQTVTEVAYI